MAGFIFGDFSEQETEKFFGHDQQSVKVNEPEFPWATEECLSTTIEFGFDVPSVISPSAVNAGVSYPNYNSCNGSSSHQESTSSALTSPPYSSKSSSVENVKISKQSSSSSRHHSERKLKKKRPPNYYRQEYQQMLEPSTLQQQQQQQQINGQKDETTPIQTRPEESTTQIEQNANETNLFLLPTGDARYISCDQWVHSTMQHQQISTNAHDDDDQSSSKQSINDDDEIDSESHDTTTDTDNDTELQQSSSTTRPTNPLDIVSTDRNLQIKSTNSTENCQNLNPQNNDLNIYSTSVASGASIETLKASNNPPSPTSSSPVKQTIDLSKSKPSSWADLFRSQTQSNSSNVVVVQPPPPPPSPPTINKTQPTEISTAKINSNAPANNFYPRTNYHVYNSNGGESKSLEDYFTKCEVRPSAMAIKPRGLQNKNNYCYVNATLQALLACPAFFNVMKYIPLNEDPVDHQVPSIKSIHKFVNQFEKMDRSKSTSNASTPNHKDIVCGQPFDPIEVLEEISRLRRIPLEIVKNQQEDAHELLTQLLNELHDEICSIVYPNSDEISPQTTSETTPIVATTTMSNGEEKAEDWLQVGKKNRTHVLRTNEIRKSLIADIFAGKFRSTVHSAGNQKSVIHEPFFTLSLDIKDPKITTLDEALIRFCEQSNVSDYVDSKTRQQINTNKNMLIEQLPPILIIHLKCFLYDEADGTKKLMKLINYSINLTLPKSILADSAKKQPERYKLFAVEHHQGDQASKGHYITDVFHPGLQGWIRYNDANVQVVPSNHVINPNMDKLTPYLLFYRRGD